MTSWVPTCSPSRENSFEGRLYYTVYKNKSGELFFCHSGYDQDGALLVPVCDVMYWHIMREIDNNK